VLYYYVLSIGWGMRALRFEEKARTSEIELVRECWKEKRMEEWKDTYEIERKRFYNRYGWDIEEGEDSVRDLEGKEREMRERERERIREEGKIKIAEARYNKKYKEILAEKGIPRYLKKSNLESEIRGDGIRALMKLRFGNLEEWNKFWIEEDRRKCKFCRKGRDNMEHYIEDCRVAKDWFKGLSDIIKKKGGIGYGVKTWTRKREKC